MRFLCFVDDAAAQADPNDNLKDAAADLKDNLNGTKKSKKKTTPKIVCAYFA